MTCTDCPCSAAVLAGMARLEAMVAQLPPPREPETPQICGPSLLEALAAATAGGWFTSGEVWRDHGTDPDLADALAAEVIRTSHGLGRWLARQGDAVERVGDLWRVSGFAAHETGETGHPVDRSAG